MFAICPLCYKTIEVQSAQTIICPECGGQFGYSKLKKVDKREEIYELELAKGHFRNAEYTLAHEHFVRALKANANSYQARYYVQLCNIYLHESDKFDSVVVPSDEFDFMSAVMDMVEDTLDALENSSISIKDRLAFVSSVVIEVKSLISNKFSARDKLFDSRIDEYRRITIADLTRLLSLFKLDREQIMSFAPEVTKEFVQIIDSAMKACYKAVQTVIKGKELYAPSESDYKKLLSLSNEYCYFGHTFNPDFDAKVYAPDFSPNYALNKKVLEKFKKFDEENRANAKKYIIANIKEYEDILDECRLALRYTYLNCYRSMCSRQVEQHAQLFVDGFDMLFRLLLPRVAQPDKKRIEVRVSKFADIADYCDILTRFAVDATYASEELGSLVRLALREYYEKLYDIVEIYFVPEINRLSKLKISDEVLAIVQKTLFDCACCCAPALRKYVDFSAETDKTKMDKTRAKLALQCKDAAEGFLLRSGMSIDEIEQSNFYRPILQISLAAGDEASE